MITLYMAINTTNDYESYLQGVFTSPYLALQSFCDDRCYIAQDNETVLSRRGLRARKTIGIIRPITLNDKVCDYI